MARQALVILVVVAAFGILVPLYKGIGFLDPRIIAAYACLALLFVAPASAELAAAQGSSAPASAVIGKIALIVAWGWGMTVLILSTAMVTLNLVGRGSAITDRSVLLPPAEFSESVLAFSLTASIAIAVLGALLARRFPAKTVKTMLRTGFLAILVLLIFGSRVLPESVQLEILEQFSTRRALTHLAWELSGAFAGIAALLLIVLFQTARGLSSAKIPMTENHNQGG